jgi:hypothetical protein
MISRLLLASGLLLAAIPACQDDSVYRSGDVPPSILDGSLGDGAPADGAVGGMGGGGSGGAPTDSDGGAD